MMTTTGGSSNKALVIQLNQLILVVIVIFCVDIVVFEIKSQSFGLSVRHTSG